MTNARRKTKKQNSSLLKLLKAFCICGDNHTVAMAVEAGDDFIANPMLQHQANANALYQIEDGQSQQPPPSSIQANAVDIDETLKVLPNEIASWLRTQIQVYVDPTGKNYITQDVLPKCIAFIADSIKSSGSSELQTLNEIAKKEFAMNINPERFKKMVVLNEIKSIIQQIDYCSDDKLKTLCEMEQEKLALLQSFDTETKATLTHIDTSPLIPQNYQELNVDLEVLSKDLIAKFNFISSIKYKQHEANYTLRQGFQNVLLADVNDEMKALQTLFESTLTVYTTVLENYNHHYAQLENHIQLLNDLINQPKLSRRS